MAAIGESIDRKLFDLRKEMDSLHTKWQPEALFRDTEKEQGEIKKSVTKNVTSTIEKIAKSIGITIEFSQKSWLKITYVGRKKRRKSS